MKHGCWHFPVKILAVLFIVVTVSGLAAAGVSSLSLAGKNSAATINDIPVSIESVSPPENSVARINQDRLGFTLSLTPAAGRSCQGTFNLKNLAGEDIVVALSVDKPDDTYIDFIDPVYGVSGQAGRQLWRLHLRKDSVATISYLIQAGTAVESGSYEIEVRLVTEAFSWLRFTPITAGMRMWGGGTSAPPAAISHAWPMFRHDARHTGRSSYAGLAFKVYNIAGGFISSSPAIDADGTVYVGSDNNKLIALNPDGTLKWSYTTNDDVVSSPALADDGTVYFGSNDKKFYALDTDGNFKWSYPTGEAIGSPPVLADDGTIYFGSSDKELYALDTDGNFKWSYTAGKAIGSSPALAADGTIYFGSDDFNLYALNPDSTLKWSYTAGGEIFSSPAIGADGTIYFGSIDHHLYALNPDSTLKWSFDAGDKVYSSPAIGADGTVVYVQGGGTAGG
jgi:outer membrane protein assembly factor BamB